MPTLRGIAVAIAGLGLIALGSAFGAEGLGMIGFGLVVLVAAALVVVRLGRHDLVTTRRVEPDRVNAEQPVRITLEVRNKGTGRVPILLLEDALPAATSGRARFTLMGLEPAGKRSISYDLRAPKRGRYAVGPLHVTFADPFRLARIRTIKDDLSHLLVHPRVEQLAPPRDLGQYRSPAVSALRQLTGARGDDFYTMREYVEGDDLRKVHWASTAKRDRLMIRQEETPWHTRATILLDDRATSGGHASFERAIEACASVTQLYSRSGYSFRLLCTSGAGVGANRGSNHYVAVLDLLATLQPAVGLSDGDLMGRLVELQTVGAAEGTLVVLARELDEDHIAAIGACRRRFRDVVAVLFPPRSHAREGDAAPEAVAGRLARSGAKPILVGPHQSFARSWNALSGRARAMEQAWEQKQERV